MVKTCSFLTKAFLINVSKRTRWSNVLWFFLKPHCFSERRPCGTRDHVRRVLIILSIILHKQLVNAIGLKLPGSEWSLPGLGMGTTTATRYDGGKQPDSHTWLYTFKRTDRAEFGRCVKSLIWTWSKAVAESLALCNDCLNSVKTTLTPLTHLNQDTLTPLTHLNQDHINSLFVGFQMIYSWTAGCSFGSQAYLLL